MDNKKRAKLIFSKLVQNYSSVPMLFLDYKTDAQMLCAIILSAQSTDAQVNKVTKKLFKKYKSVNDFSNANLKTFEQEIRSTGFYKQKAKRVIECFKIIKNVYGGKIPLKMDELIKLPGVGRKTANLVLANKGIIKGIAVDTHVARLAQRMGFTKFSEQFKIEKDLLNIFDKNKWSRVNGLFISHGRKICVARNPKCDICFLNKKNLCPRKGLN
ncbi:MAG: G/T mismatches repair enzyme [archaeon ADurb.Bin336]|nr:MAG: G/T mismatches repair enzyme [archaeon ADurb.Bin336]